MPQNKRKSPPFFKGGYSLSKKVFFDKLLGYRERCRMAFPLTRRSTMVLREVKKMTNRRKNGENSMFSPFFFGLFFLLGYGLFNYFVRRLCSWAFIDSLSPPFFKGGQSNVVYFKILNFPTRGNSLALPFAALIMPKIAKAAKGIHTRPKMVERML